MKIEIQKLPGSKIRITRGVQVWTGKAFSLLFHLGEIRIYGQGTCENIKIGESDIYINGKRKFESEYLSKLHIKKQQG